MRRAGSSSTYHRAIKLMAGVADEAEIADGADRADKADKVYEAD